MPNEHGDIRPNPDPTRLTIEMLDREVRHLSELHENDIRSLRDLSDAQDNTRDVMIASMRESLDNLRQTYLVGHGVLVSSIDEMKNRLTALEAKARTGKESMATLYVVIGLLISLGVLAVTALHVWH